MMNIADRELIPCADCQGHGTRVNPFDITDVQDCAACLGQGCREMNEEEYNEGTWQ
jgi:DnaJ-class molecular chaperone